MTYKETFMACLTPTQLVETMLKEMQVAIFFDVNPDRLKDIDDAFKETLKEKGWEVSM